MEFYCASFGRCEKFAPGCLPTQTPTQKLKSWLLGFSFQEIGSSLISLEMILEALQSELFRFKFHILSSKILKLPEINVSMLHRLCKFSKSRILHFLGKSLTWNSTFQIRNPKVYFDNILKQRFKSDAITVTVCDTILVWDHTWLKFHDLTSASIR